MRYGECLTDVLTVLASDTKLIKPMSGIIAGTTLALSGIPRNDPRFSLRYLAHYIDRLLDTDEIGTFRLREVRNKVVIDFNSSYDAMIAQGKLDGQSFQLEDGIMQVVRARVCFDAAYSPSVPLPVAEPESSPDDENKTVLKKVDRKIDAELKILKVKKKYLSTEEQMLERERDKIKALLEKISSEEETDASISKKKKKKSKKSKKKRKSSSSSGSESDSDTDKSSRHSKKRLKGSSSPIVDKKDLREKLRDKTTMERDRGISLSRRDRSPYSKEILPYHRGGSPYNGRRSPFHRRGSPNHRGRSPSHRGGSPNHRGRSPNHRGRSPSHRGGSPNHRGRSPNHRGRSPSHRGGSPNHRGGSPNHRGRSPNHRRRSPSHRGKSPSHTSGPTYYRERYPTGSPSRRDRSGERDLSYATPTTSKEVRLPRRSREFRSRSRSREPIYRRSRSPGPSYRRDLRSDSRYGSVERRGRSDQKAICYNPNVSMLYKPTDRRTYPKDDLHRESILVKKEVDIDKAELDNKIQNAIKTILLNMEKPLHNLSVTYNANDVNRKMVLLKMFEIVKKRFKYLKVNNNMTEENLVMHYRCKFSKIEDEDKLHEIFTSVISAAVEADKSQDKQNQDTILNELDSVLQELDLAGLMEDVKPKIEQKDEEEEGEITDITITIVTTPAKTQDQPTKEPEDPLKQVYVMNDEEYGYRVRITVKKTRPKFYYLIIKRILRNLLPEMKKYTDHIQIELFTYIIKLILEKRITAILEGKEEKIKAVKVVEMYREIYPEEDNKQFVIDALCAVWRGEYNDDVYTDTFPPKARRRKNNNVTSNGEVTVKQVPSEDNITEIKKEKDSESQATEIKKEKDTESQATEIKKEKDTMSQATEIKKEKDTMSQATEIKKEKDAESQASEQIVVKKEPDSNVTVKEKNASQIKQEKDVPETTENIKSEKVVDVPKDNSGQSNSIKDDNVKEKKESTNKAVKKVPDVKIEPNTTEAAETKEIVEKGSLDAKNETVVISDEEDDCAIIEDDAEKIIIDGDDNDKIVIDDDKNDKIVIDDDEKHNAIEIIDDEDNDTVELENLKTEPQEDEKVKAPKNQKDKRPEHINTEHTQFSKNDNDDKADSFDKNVNSSKENNVVKDNLIAAAANKTGDNRKLNENVKSKPNVEENDDVEESVDNILEFLQQTM